MDHRLSNDAYLAHLATDGRALIAAVGAAPDAQVAACPEWTNTGLAEHVAMVWNFAMAQVESGDESGPQRPSPDPDESMPDLLDRTVATLGDGDPDAPAWNWAGDPAGRLVVPPHGPRDLRPPVGRPGRLRRRPGRSTPTWQLTASTS